MTTPSTDSSITEGGLPAPATPKPPSRVVVAWDGDHRFDAGRPGGPTIRLDASAETGPSPVDAVLIALASCTGVDIVDIIAKRRTPVQRFAIDVTGDRADGTPRRLLRIHLAYDIGGAAIEREHAERAIELSITKYCSVRDSLAPDIVITWALTLNGELGATHTIL